MKDSFLRFFMGKMEKSVYIAAVSVIVCLATVVGSTAIAHNHNKKIDAALENLTQVESINELYSASVTEMENNEPFSDKALQYLAEFDKLTAEYNRERADLESQIKPLFLLEDEIGLPIEPIEQDSEEQIEWEKANANKISEIKSRNAEKQKQNETIEQSNADIRSKLSLLDAQYEKDVAALKAKYGIQ